VGEFSAFLAELNGVLWHEYVLYAIVGTGILFTVWSGFSQYRALTHGPSVLRGVYDDPDHPGLRSRLRWVVPAQSSGCGSSACWAWRSSSPK
jgi:AGCS family alanine or glycine:cation symporter